MACFNHPDEDFETRLHTCGKPFPGIDVRIVDPETGEELPSGERGEIQLRGYAMFEGYYKDPDKNAEAFVDGWFRSGDLCSVTEDGAICFHGRLKDMLKVGGENVAALEIESVLAAHPAVRMAQVIAVPDARLQEVPVAYIECNDTAEGGDTVSEAELISFCAGQMASFKVPVAVRFITEWPRVFDQGAEVCAAGDVCQRGKPASLTVLQIPVGFGLDFEFSRETLGGL